MTSSDNGPVLIPTLILLFLRILSPLGWGPLDATKNNRSGGPRSGSRVAVKCPDMLESPSFVVAGLLAGRERGRRGGETIPADRCHGNVTPRESESPASRLRS